MDLLVDEWWHGAVAAVGHGRWGEDILGVDVEGVEAFTPIEEVVDSVLEGGLVPAVELRTSVSV